MTTVVISSSQSWPCPAGVIYVDVTLVGGGGHGGDGGSSDYSTQKNGEGGRGGVAGQVSSVSKVSVTPGVWYSITIGGSGANTMAFGITATAGSAGVDGRDADIGHSYNAQATKGSSGYTGIAGYPTAGNGTGTYNGAGGSGYGAGGGGGSGKLWDVGGGGVGGSGAPGVVIITYYITSPSFSADSTSGIFPKTVNFTGTATESPLAWHWSFGDGDISTDQNPTHVYSSSGKKTVALTVTNAYSEVTATQTDYITIFCPPTVRGYLITAEPWRR